MIEIEVYTATYAPWEEGQDEPNRINDESETLHFGSAVDCADWLDHQGFNEPSESGPYRFRTWLNDEPYKNPYTGVTTERTAHAGQLTDARIWAAIVAKVTRPWTGYAGPYYIERTDAFGYKI